MEKRTTRNLAEREEAAKDYYASVRTNVSGSGRDALNSVNKIKNSDIACLGSVERKPDLFPRKLAHAHRSPAHPHRHYPDERPRPRDFYFFGPHSCERIPGIRSCVCGTYKHYRECLVLDVIHQPDKPRHLEVLTFNTVPCNPDVYGLNRCLYAVPFLFRCLYPF